MTAAMTATVPLWPSEIFLSAMNILSPQKFPLAAGRAAHKNFSKTAPILLRFSGQDDSIAAGAIPTLQNRNLRIPKDISVISVGDLKYAQSISPMLTTIHIPAEELGRMAAKTLIDRINGGHRLTLTVTLPFFIVRRESCSEPKSY